jgi:hypothetical protein
MRTLDIIAGVLLIVGALNWGLVGLAEFDLVAFLTGESFGTTNILGRIIYGLVGLAAVYELAAVRGLSKRWSGSRHHAAA